MEFPSVSLIREVITIEGLLNWVIVASLSSSALHDRTFPSFFGTRLTRTRGNVERVADPDVMAGCVRSVALGDNGNVSAIVGRAPRRVPFLVPSVNSTVSFH